MIQQLSLFEEAPPPIPAHTDPETPAPGAAFYVGGWRVWKVGLTFGPGTDHGWHLSRRDGPRLCGAHCPRALREVMITSARVAGLPNDLHARDWRRYPSPNAHWLHWPENSVSICRWPTLEENIASARRMRPMSELRAWAEAERAAAEAKKTKKRKKAA